MPLLRGSTVASCGLPACLPGWHTADQDSYQTPGKANVYARPVCTMLLSYNTNNRIAKFTQHYLRKCPRALTKFNMKQFSFRWRLKRPEPAIWKVDCELQASKESGKAQAALNKLST